MKIGRLISPFSMLTHRADTDLSCWLRPLDLMFDTEFDEYATYTSTSAIYARKMTIFQNQPQALPKSGPRVLEYTEFNLSAVKLIEVRQNDDLL